MTDRERLLNALIVKSDRRAGADISVLDVIALLEKTRAEHQLAVHHKLVVPAPRTRVRGHMLNGEADPLPTALVPRGCPSTLHCWFRSRLSAPKLSVWRLGAARQRTGRGSRLRMPQTRCSW